MAITKKFKLGETEFYSYRARDSHGSCCNTYMVDQKSVSYDVYWRKIVATLKEMDAWEPVVHACRHQTADFCI